MEFMAHARSAGTPFRVLSYLVAAQLPFERLDTLPTTLALLDLLSLYAHRIFFSTPYL